MSGWAFVEWFQVSGNDSLFDELQGKLAEVYRTGGGSRLRDIKVVIMTRTFVADVMCLSLVAISRGAPGHRRHPSSQASPAFPG